MNRENMETNLVREEDLMTEEEMRAWEEVMEKGMDLGDDPLELLKHNSSVVERAVETGNGPDDGDLL